MVKDLAFLAYIKIQSIMQISHFCDCLYLLESDIPYAVLCAMQFYIVNKYFGKGILNIVRIELLKEIQTNKYKNILYL